MCNSLLVMKHMFERRLLGGIPENICSCEDPCRDGSCPFGQVVSRDSISEKPPDGGILCRPACGPLLEGFAAMVWGLVGWSRALYCRWPLHTSPTLLSSAGGSCLGSSTTPRERATNISREREREIFRSPGVVPC